MVRWVWERWMDGWIKYGGGRRMDVVVAVRSRSGSGVKIPDGPNRWDWLKHLFIFLLSHELQTSNQESVDKQLVIAQLKKLPKNHIFIFFGGIITSTIYFIRIKAESDMCMRSRLCSCHTGQFSMLAK